MNDYFQKLRELATNTTFDYFGMLRQESNKPLGYFNQLRQLANPQTAMAMQPEVQPKQKEIKEEGNVQFQDDFRKASIMIAKGMMTKEQAKQQLAKIYPKELKTVEKLIGDIFISFNE